MQPATATAVRYALRYNLNHYRVRRAQAAALVGPADAISGMLLLALMCRETWGRNIEGGARLVNGVWVPEDRTEFMDVGAIQISRRWQAAKLKEMPAVRAGTWGPVVPGKSPMDRGFVPQFEDQLLFTIAELRARAKKARGMGVPAVHAMRVAIAGHNGGDQPIYDFLKYGDPDRNTSGADYSAWVLGCRTQVYRVLHEPRFANWLFP